MVEHNSSIGSFFSNNKPFSSTSKSVITGTFHIHRTFFPLPRIFIFRTTSVIIPTTHTHTLRITLHVLPPPPFHSLVITTIIQLIKLFLLIPISTINFLHPLMPTHRIIIIVILISIPIERIFRLQLIHLRIQILVRHPHIPIPVHPLRPSSPSCSCLALTLLIFIDAHHSPPPRSNNHPIRLQINSTSSSKRNLVFLLFRPRKDPTATTRRRTKQHNPRIAVVACITALIIVEAVSMNVSFRLFTTVFIPMALESVPPMA
jgi:hypothetical protein